MSESKEKKLFLLDAFALIFRAHFAFSNNPRISSKGVNTSVMFGFTNTLLEVLHKQKPSHIAVVFDTSAPTFRHEEYKEYKANRQETPEDIKTGTPVVKDIVRGFGINIIEKDGYEADDLIGTLAKKAAKEGYKVYMMTPDKDFGQLVEENIFLYKPAYMGNSVDIMGVEEVKAKWDIDDVDLVRDILGLQGDSADNIPGIPGVGPKTAAKLLKEYGSVEGIIDHVEELKGKQKERIQEFAEQGILSKRLATIVVDAPIDCDIDKLEYTGPDKKTLLPLFQDLEFRTLTKRVFDTDAGVESGQGSQLNMFAAKAAEKLSETEEPEEEIKENHSLKDTEINFLVLKSEEEVKSLVSYLLKQDRFSLESCTDDVNPVNANILGLAFSYLEGEVYYIDFTTVDEAEIKGWMKALKPVFEQDSIEISGNNLKYEMVLMRKYGIRFSAPFLDIMLAHYLIDPEVPHGLDNLSESYADYVLQADFPKYIDKSKRSAKVAKLSNREQVELCGEAAQLTWRIAEKIGKEVQQGNTKSLYNDIEAPLVPVLAEMEINGVTINQPVLSEMSAEVGTICEGLEKNIFEEAGEEFNVNSPKQLGEILFDKLKLVDKPKKTKSGQYATGEEILRKLVDHPIVSNIMEYRELQKLKSTYIDALPNMVSPYDQKIHTNYSQAVAATGRLSSINPNLQNIPIRTERGKLIRKAFIPESADYQIFSADYSQIELRIMASFSEDKHMVDAFNEGKDIHAATAARVFGVSLDEVDEAMRRKAKSVNFGLIYGQTAFGLSQNLNISRTEAKEIIDAYFNEFSAVKSYMDAVINQARENEYVETLLGRRRYLRDINSRNQTMRGFAERNAINAPIQGSAADIIKLAMIKVQQYLEQENLKSKMIMQVHDELVLELHKDEADAVSRKVVELMENAYKLKVPMIVDSGMGKDWLEAH